jgi:hypothetical protein
VYSKFSQGRETLTSNACSRQKALLSRRYPSIGNLQSYHALSYWSGFDQPRKPIFMYGELISEENRKRVPIFVEVFYAYDNLAAALRQFRQKSRGDTCLWVDSICIKQENLNEKSAQVSGNRWFSRRWLIQELAFARKPTVHWG